MPRADTPRTGVARALSKLGFCSRAKGRALAEAGRVRVNGRIARDPETPVVLGRDRLEVDGVAIGATAKVYVALNKPRGLVTTASDERGRETVYRCLDGAGLPFVSPVGRLDRASEGLLLFTNDGAWAARLSSPEHGVEKTYHVQIDRVADDALLSLLRAGVVDDFERLAAKRARVLRTGAKTSWLEIVLDEGRNRQIRRMLAALGVEVSRLVRVAIGPLALGALGKGEFRHLTPEEVARLSGRDD